MPVTHGTKFGRQKLYDNFMLISKGHMLNCFIYVIKHILCFHWAKFQTCKANDIFLMRTLVKNERLHTGRLHMGHFF